jgi:hypothetical protein
MSDNEIKQQILDVSQLPGTVDQLDTGSVLGNDLGFNDNMCADLAQRLGVNNSDITTDMTVQNVIDLVNKKS